MSRKEISCKELVEIVTEYLEGTLAPIERQLFEEHLVICEGCRNYLDQMRITLHLVGKLDEEDLPLPDRENIVNLFREWNRP